MFTHVKVHKHWSDIAAIVLIVSIVAAVVLTIADGLVKGPIGISRLINASEAARAYFIMYATWILDFRYLAEQTVLAAALFFVGTKFLETRAERLKDSVAA